MGALDCEEIIHLLEKRHVYLESISKLYNELTMINKIKSKEFENLADELEEVTTNRTLA